MYARDIAGFATPIGTVCVTGTKEWVESIGIVSEMIECTASDGAILIALSQLREWFAGTRMSFDLPLAPSATPRGDALRSGMTAIPYGDTMSYGELATATGSSARAIGQACARNPFPIVVPCHRVLNAGGTIGAYSAGDGPTTKSWLLEFERRNAGRTLL